MRLEPFIEVVPDVPWVVDLEFYRHYDRLLSQGLSLRCMIKARQVLVLYDLAMTLSRATLNT